MIEVTMGDVFWRILVPVMTTFVVIIVGVLFAAVKYLLKKQEESRKQFNDGMQESMDELVKEVKSEFKRIDRDMRETTDAFLKYQKHVAENYTTKQDMKDIVSQLGYKIDGMNTKIDGVIMDRFQVLNRLKDD